jgi:hypothetical protein
MKEKTLKVPKGMETDISQALQLIVDHCNREKRIVVRDDEYQEKLSRIIAWAEEVIQELQAPDHEPA